jgi:hypothetical protein
VLLHVTVVALAACRYASAAATRSLNHKPDASCCLASEVTAAVGEVCTDTNFGVIWLQLLLLVLHMLPVKPTNHCYLPP